MFLESYLTTIPTPDARPEKVADLGFRVGTRVTVPYLDSRICNGIQLDMHENIVRNLFEFDGDGVAIRDKTLELGLKVYYRNRPVFNGPLSAPKFDYDTGRIELVAHDPSLRLKRTPVYPTDSPVVDGITLDGEGLLSLIDLAQNTSAENTAGDPVLGIVRGIDTTTDLYSDALTKLSAGDYIWDSIKNFSDAVTTPDFALTPIETDPAELASGAEFANYFTTAADIADNATTDFDLTVTLPGNIGGLKLGIWAEHTRPADINIDLVHPDGTSVRVYTGSREATPTSPTGVFLGNGTGASACYFEVGHSKAYGAYPHVGTFRPDRSLNGLLDKLAAGTWKLRVHDTASGSTGTVAQFYLAFTLPDPAYCRMDVSDKPDTSALSNALDAAGLVGPSCVFNKGHGNDNARTLSVTPQGDQVRNRFTAVAQALAKTAKDDASRHAYGRYGGYESPRERASAEFLRDYAKAQVGGYARPLPVLDVAPIDDGGTNRTLRFGEDFYVGRHVLAVGKRGNAYHEILGRVTEVTLTQQQSSVRTDMDVIPAVAGADEEA